MSRFLDDAVRIFETASAGAGSPSSELGILLDGAGGLRIVDAAGWNPEALRLHYGARTLYQVTRRGAGVEVAGNGPGHSCLLRSEAPRVPSLHLPAGVPQYTLVLPALPA